ncbi:MAG: molybdopterin molybdotransferase MoeA [Saprospiraceae bacterium]|nr:molybdopterin molybdotransferase MoeA [Saprospiraceae bacterium]
MISVEEATRLILQRASDFGEEEVPLDRANGRVLCEDLMADRDFPPFTRVTMDGIAIKYEAYERGQRKFPILGVQPAGAPQQSLSQPEACLEVMTGAILPAHADTVIRYEDIEINDGLAIITTEKVKHRQNAHPRGEDRRKGDIIVEKGGIISPAEIGVAATVGKSRIRVAKLPEALIVYTGDELVEVEEIPKAHQIRSSNAHSIMSTLSEWGIRADRAHLIDDKPSIRKTLSKALKDYSLLVISGGVSKGKFDFLPEVLAELGVEKAFHKVKQRPGKPLWFGHHPSSGCVVFALPGNPVSSYMCTYRYVIPWLRKSLGLTPFLLPTAILREPFEFGPELTYFLQVKVRINPREARLEAKAVAGKGSGDLANLADADGFLELPPDKSVFSAEEVYPLYFYRKSIESHV